MEVKTRLSDQNKQRSYSVKNKSLSKGTSSTNTKNN